MLYAAGMTRLDTGAYIGMTTARQGVTAA